MSKKKEKSFPKTQVTSAFVAVVAIVFGIFTFLTSRPESRHFDGHLTYWPVSLGNDNLRTTKNVFERLGYREVNGSSEKWDVLWSIAFPFDQYSKTFFGVKPHQSVNHIPGITFLTNKMYLAINTHNKYIPIAFEFPKLKNEFLYYQKTFPNATFVVKNFDKQGIKIVQPRGMDFFMGNLKFVQKFVDNPLLIDGKAFDLGVFVLITSVNPLRIYRYKRDILLRFCPEPYHPFDPENVDKYVVTDSHLSSWEIPPLKSLIESFGFSPLDSFQHYLRTHGHNIAKLWEHADDAITEITLSKLKPISRHLENFEMSTLGRKRKLFELLRFDFIIDEQMNLHLMEIDMSPSLTPTKRDYENLSAAYEQLVYNTLSIVGASTRVALKPSSIDEIHMLSTSKDIAVSLEDCVQSGTSCEDLNLCLTCLSNEDSENIHQAYREHQRRGEMRRIFPRKTHVANELMKNVSNSTKLLAKWFKRKCENDFDWC